jgi:hypothetical protein
MSVVKLYQEQFNQMLAKLDEISGKIVPSPMIWNIPITGRATGTTATSGTMVFSAETDLTVTATGGVSIVSITRADDSVYRLHTVVFNCTNATIGQLRVVGAEKVVSLSNNGGISTPNTNFYTGVDATAPILNWNLNQLPINTQKIRQTTAYLNILPATGNQAFPVNLTYLFLSGNNINWTYSGALPVNLTILTLSGTNINWTYSGALPVNLTILHLSGTNINWTYSGALPVNLIYLLLSGANINWTGRLLEDVTILRNYTTLTLQDYRNPNSTLAPAELLIWLQNIKNLTGTLPATIEIREYDNSPTTTAIQSATPNIAGTTEEQLRYWINQVLTGKGCTTVQINTTNITL